MHEELLKVQHGINQIEEWCILVQENIILVIYFCSYIFIGTHHIYRFIIYQLIKTLPRVSQKKKKKHYQEVDTKTKHYQVRMMSLRKFHFSNSN